MCKNETSKQIAVAAAVWFVAFSFLPAMVSVHADRGGSPRSEPAAAEAPRMERSSSPRVESAPRQPEARPVESAPQRQPQQRTFESAPRQESRAERSSPAPQPQPSPAPMRSSRSSDSYTQRGSQNTYETYQAPAAPAQNRSVGNSSGRTVTRPVRPRTVESTGTAEMASRSSGSSGSSRQVMTVSRNGSSGTATAAGSAESRSGSSRSRTITADRSTGEEISRSSGTSRTTSSESLAMRQRVTTPISAPSERTVANVERVTGSQIRQQMAERTREAQPVDERPAERAAEPAPAERPSQREPDPAPIERPEPARVETPAEPVREPVAERPSERAAEPVREPVTERPAEPARVETPAEPVREPVAERPAERAAEPVRESVTERPAERPSEPAVDQVREPVTEKPAERTAQPQSDRTQAAERTPDAAGRTAEGRIDKSTDRTETERTGKTDRTNRTAERAARPETRTASADRQRTSETQRTAADRGTDRTADRTERTDRTVASRDADVRPALREETAQRARMSGTREISGGTSTRDRTAQRDISTGGARPQRNYEPDNAGKIVVNGNNNVIIQGDVNIERPRPYIAPRLYHHDLHHYHHNWHDHGSYFSFVWSTSSCGTVLWAPYHDYYGFSYCYPAYHRKYVFVSIGGYWPTCYRYRRYYWYGCHPHYWYGTHIVTEAPVVNNTYNTYNYYNTEPQAAATTVTTNVYDNPPLAKTTEVVNVIDAPNDENIVDICFAHGVKVFGDGNYPEAVERFRRAVQMDPEDVILPFTYAQALFANEEYALAASVLRGAVQNVPDNELTIYFPRGLYEDEKVLTDQVKCLEQAIELEPFVADYKLLLGYQYLGMDDLQKARGTLFEAAKDSANRETAAKLMELADRLEAEKARAAEDAKSGKPADK